MTKYISKSYTNRLLQWVVTWIPDLIKTLLETTSHAETETDTACILNRLRVGHVATRNLISKHFFCQIQPDKTKETSFIKHRQ